MDSILSNYPEYKVPEKWTARNDWSQRGYDFLTSRVFYFKSNPEEMYYVTFVNDMDSLENTKSSEIAVRAVYNDSSPKWLQVRESPSNEKERINRRFKLEIVSKLEQYTNTKSEVN